MNDQRVFARFVEANPVPNDQPHVVVPLYPTLEMAHQPVLEAPNREPARVGTLGTVAVAVGAAIAASVTVTLLLTGTGGPELKPPSATITTMPGSTTMLDTPTTTVPDTTPDQATENPEVSDLAPTEPDPNRFQSGPLDAGTYTTASTPMPVSYTLKPGWTALTEDKYGTILLARAPIQCNPECGPDDGLAVVISQHETSIENLTALIIEELTSPSTLVGARLESYQVQERQIGDRPAITITHQSAGGTNPAYLASIWPHEPTNQGIRPLVFAGPHQTVLIPINDTVTLVAHHILGAGQQPDDQIQNFLANTEEVLATLTPQPAPPS
jgi:hypothetical protein